MTDSLVKDPNDPRVFEKPRWVAKLSNDEYVYESGTEDWKKLKYYLAKNNIRIVDFCLQFRSNVVRPFLDYKDGYFLIYRSEVIDFGANIKTYYVVGTISIKHDLINASIFSIPELEYCGYSVRKFTEQMFQCPESCII